MPPSITRLAHGASAALSTTASTLAGWRGTFVEHAADQPARPLRLYEFEACPHCRRVRETLTELGLDAEIRPCPKGGRRFRDEARALGGIDRYPFLIDENTGVALHESDAIVAYLVATYGPGDGSVRARAALPLPLRVLPVAARFARGRRVRRSRAPAEPLHLWSFESSPFSRLVRERLTELELPYTVHNLGKEEWREVGPAVRRIAPNPYVPKPGGKRREFFERHRRVQVPYLEDPNTGAAMFESRRIVDYLERTYAADA